MNTQKKLEALIEKFVAEAQSLMADSAREQLLAAIGAAPGATVVGKRRGPKATKPAKGAAKPAKAAAPAKGAKPAKAAKGGKRIRRTPEQLAQVEGKILKLLAASPKLTSEEIQEKLNMSKPEIQLPLTMMREAGKLKTVGVRRGMRYSVK